MLLQGTGHRADDGWVRYKFKHGIAHIKSYNVAVALLSSVVDGFATKEYGWSGLVIVVRTEKELFVLAAGSKLARYG